MTTYPPRVLLAELTERTSANGNRYVSGWLGKARIIGFWSDGEDREGNATTVLRLFVQEPDQKPQERQPGRSPASAAPRRQEVRQRAAYEAQRRHDDVLANLNDPIPY
jgi:hypothetical protein